jgi:hypothetical protein
MANRRYDRTMTASPYGNTPGGQWPPTGSPQGPPPGWPTSAPKQGRAPTIISLVVALVAIALAIGAWFRPAPQVPTPADNSPHYSDLQIAEAKKALCAAEDLVNRATTYAGNQKSDDPTQQLAIAVNVRLTGSLSAQYFQTKLTQYPATPKDLTTGLQELILANQDIALLQIANASKDEFDSSYQAYDAAQSKVTEACK